MSRFEKRGVYQNLVALRGIKNLMMKGAQTNEEKGAIR
jgi:hypothetical protein